MRTLHAIAAALILVTGTTVTVLAQDGDDPQPDLVPADVSNAPEDPIEGENVTFTATIENDGEADATSSFNVTFLVDGEQVGENKTVDSLRFGDSTQVTSDNWTSTSGQHDVRVIVDAHDDVEESDETNNEQTETFDVAAAEVDLVVAELAADPETPVEGDNVTLEAVVANEGNVASNNTTLRFFVNGSALGADVDVPALEPGENATVTSQNWTAAEGEHTLRAFVDPARETDEADEANNDIEEEITVEPIEANLHVTEITLDPTSPEPGENVTFTANISNDGHSDAANITVRFLVDNEELSNATIGNLSAGENTTLTSAEWNATEGQHTVRVEVDTDDNVTESDEDDNARAKSFAVTTEDEDQPPEGDEGEEGDDADDEADEREDAEDEEQITICHVPPGNPDKRHTITVGEPAWDAHEDHGDHKGACEDEGTDDAEQEDDAEAGSED